MNLTPLIVALSVALSASPCFALSPFQELRRLHGGEAPEIPAVGAPKDATPPKAGVLQQLSDEVSALYRKVAPAVVKIIIDGDENVQKAIAMHLAEEEIDKALQARKLMEEFQAWLKTQGRPDLVSSDAMGTGSGFVIDSRGLIITNDHVVKYEKLGARVKVQFHDGKTVGARVLWLSADDALALIQAQVRGPVPSLALGDSDRARIGDVACALGNPLGLESVFTCGTITALNPKHGIQHDASITNGNSGGPLLNAAGEVVGVNYMVIKDESGSVEPGMGFAIPINIVKAKALK